MKTIYVHCRDYLKIVLFKYQLQPKIDVRKLELPWYKLFSTSLLVKIL